MGSHLSFVFLVKLAKNCVKFFAFFFKNRKQDLVFFCNFQLVDDHDPVLIFFLKLSFPPFFPLHPSPFFPGKKMAQYMLLIFQMKNGLFVDSLIDVAIYEACVQLWLICV
jgi:hypothetical protein